MKFKFWSDTNMVNCAARMEDQGVPFRSDLLKNVISVDDYDEAAGDIAREEGGEELRHGQ